MSIAINVSEMSLDGLRSLEKSIHEEIERRKNCEHPLHMIDMINVTVQHPFDGLPCRSKIVNSVIICTVTGKCTRCGTTVSRTSSMDGKQ